MSNQTKEAIESIYVYCRVIKKCTVLISQAFKGQFVVPEFTEFTRDIVEIYDKYAPKKIMCFLIKYWLLKPMSRII